MKEASRESIRRLFPEVARIGDRDLAEKVVAVLAELSEESEWGRVEDIPFNSKIPDTPLVTHIRFVARAALALAEIHRELYGTEVDADLLLAAALVHDGNKFVDFLPSEGGPLRPSGHRRFFPGSAYSAHKQLEHGLPWEVVNTTLTHSPSSAATPATVEGVILHYADLCDADVFRFVRSEPLLMRR